MKSILSTGPGLVVKIVYSGAAVERTIGYASDLTYTVMQGQKLIFTVDSPFPAEIAQAAGPTYVRGSMNIFLPKGTTPESLGLVSYRSDKAKDGFPLHAASGYFHLRIVDRDSSGTVLSLDYCKVASYNMSIAARAVVRVSLSFEGMLMTPGNTK